MSTEKSNVVNLIKIVAEIKTNPRQTPEELYRSLGISKAGFYKYKQKLEGLGFRFEYRRSRKKFEIIGEEPFLPIFHLTLGEVSALIMTIGQIFSYGDYAITYRALQAIKKIIASQTQRPFQEQLQALLEATLDNNGYGVRPEILEQLEKAVETRQIVKITYFSAYDKMTEVLHEIEPYILFFKKRSLYMDANCRKAYNLKPGSEDPSGKVRTYRLNRIRRVEFYPYQTSFEVREDYSFKQRHKGGFPIFTGDTLTRVKIRVNKEKALYVQEVKWHDSQKITPDPEHPGSIFFEVEVAYPQEVMWWMRQWGPDAEVLEPKEMREYMLEMARREVEMYSENKGVKK